MPHHPPTVECLDLSRIYGEGKETRVIQHINLKIRDGEFVILHGPSGSGKSTLLHLIAGLEPPTSGEIKIRGHYLSHMSPGELANIHRTKIGLVFQQFNLIPTLSVLDNIALPQVFLNQPFHLRRVRAERLLKLLHLEKLANQRPTELSGGEQQRISIARALINDPWLLLVDEPTGNLDTITADDVMVLFQELNEHADHTIFLVTHNPAYLHLAHRVLELRDGMIVGERKVRPFRARSGPRSHHRLAALRSPAKETL